MYGGRSMQNMAKAISEMQLNFSFGLVLCLWSHASHRPLLQGSGLLSHWVVTCPLSPLAAEPGAQACSWVQLNQQQEMRSQIL